MIDDYRPLVSTEYLTACNENQPLLRRHVIRKRES
jgi:hypothetical protein